MVTNNLNMYLKIAFINNEYNLTFKNKTLWENIYNRFLYVKFNTKILSMKLAAHTLRITP